MAPPSAGSSILGNQQVLDEGLAKKGVRFAQGHEERWQQSQGLHQVLLVPCLELPDAQTRVIHSCTHPRNTSQVSTVRQLSVWFWELKRSPCLGSFPCRQARVRATYKTAEMGTQPRGLEWLIQMGVCEGRPLGGTGTCKAETWGREGARMKVGAQEGILMLVRNRMKSGAAEAGPEGRAVLGELRVRQGCKAARGESLNLTGSETGSHGGH